MSDIFEFFGHNALLTLQLCDALFIGCNNGWVIGIDDAVEEMLYLGASFLELVLHRPVHCRALCSEHGPDIAEHAFSECDEFFRWLHGCQQIGELAFDLVTTNRFAIALASLLEAHVISMMLAGLTFCVITSHGIIAVSA